MDAHALIVELFVVGPPACRYKGSIDCIVQTVKHEGPLALYKGLIPRLGRVVPGQGIIFGVYNSISPRVERLFTGGKNY